MNYILGDHIISLDRNSQRICYVSHAHSDHASAMRSKKKLIIASEETMALCGRDSKSASIPRIKLIRSGHMLGSTQLVVEQDGGVFVYTGDFKLDDGFTTKGAEVQECDYLLIEGTFGSPEMIFPKREEVCDEIVKWVMKKIENGIVLFGAYPMGKSQEIIALLNKYADIVPFVHPRISELSMIYNDFGASLKFIPLLRDQNQETLRGNFVAIMPPNMFSTGLTAGLETAYRKKVYTAFATGWTLKGWSCADKMFPLSDHADFKDIMEYIEQANPRRIFCCHGNERRLSAILREKGYDAIPVQELRHDFPQTTLVGSEKIEI